MSYIISASWAMIVYVTEFWINRYLSKVRLFTVQAVWALGQPTTTNV